MDLTTVLGEPSSPLLPLCPSLPPIRIRKRKRPSIKNLDDLINFYYNMDDEEYEDRLDLKILHSIINPLLDLDNMVGLKKIKEEIMHLVMYYLQQLNDPHEMLHTVISGPPGCGKTMLGRILGRLYTALLKKPSNKFRIVHRTDFIAKYLGQTAHRTKNLLEECCGGVMFLDEAYGMASRKDDNDSYSKEALDTLNQFLSDHCDDFVCIIAGYREELEKTFFAQNPGLQRRFPWHFTIENYDPPELAEIFERMLNEISWQYAKEFSAEEWFQNHSKELPNLGGDCAVLLTKCKIAHTHRIFGQSRKLRRRLSQEDMDEGLALFKATQKQRESDRPPPGMYL